MQRWCNNTYAIVEGLACLDKYPNAHRFKRKESYYPSVLEVFLEGLVGPRIKIQMLTAWKERKVIPLISSPDFVQLLQKRVEEM